MKDFNICEHCNLYVDLDASDCPNCGQPLVCEANGRISIWRLGGIRGGLLGYLVPGIRQAFDTGAVIQPAFLDERPSKRPKWKGVSSNIFLDQVLRRDSGETFVSLGVTEHNIVPSSRYNFLFGYAYIGFPAAVISLHMLSFDKPEPELLIRRVIGVAVHEIGHTLGLDHHGYGDGIECVMVADVEVDSLETVDGGTALFCETCRQKVADWPRRKTDSSGRSGVSCSK